MHLTTTDIRQLITHNTPIHHEIIVLSPANICHTNGSKYLDPSFFPNFQQQGWEVVKQFFSCGRHNSKSKVSLSDQNIIIPIHSGGCHWIALIRRQIRGVVHFFYSDDLNNPTTENEIRRLIIEQSTPSFCPPKMVWTSCHSLTYLPHCNECGPRAILAMAAISSSPQPNSNTLLPYMHTNLSYISRFWTAQLLPTGNVVLLPVGPPYKSVQSPFIATGYPKDLISWTEAPQTCCTTWPNTSCTLQSSTSITVDQTSPSTGIDPSSSTVWTSDVTFSYNLADGHQSPPLTPPPLKPETTTTKPTTSNHQKKKWVRLPTQLTLHDTTFCPIKQHQTADAWGHSAIQIDPDTIFRILLQNPRGLKLGTESLNTQYSLSLCQDLGVGAICLPESNVNWGHKQAHGILHRILRKTWRHSAHSTSHTEENFIALSQAGGTITMVTNKWTSRVIEKGHDPFGLGRWSYIVIRGAQGRRILLVTAYRVCRQSLSNS
jgi:hypothetical protein